MRGCLHRTLSSDGTEAEEKVEKLPRSQTRQRPLSAFEQQGRPDVPRTTCSQTTLLALCATTRKIRRL